MEPISIYGHLFKIKCLKLVVIFWEGRVYSGPIKKEVSLLIFLWEGGGGRGERDFGHPLYPLNLTRLELSHPKILSQIQDSREIMKEAAGGMTQRHFI